MSDASPLGPLESALGMEFRKWRNTRGLTIVDLSRKAGVSKATVERLENATTSTSVTLMWRVALALGIQLSVVVSGAEAAVRNDPQAWLALRKALLELGLASPSDPWPTMDEFAEEPSAAHPRPTRDVEPDEEPDPT